MNNGYFYGMLRSWSTYSLFETLQVTCAANNSLAVETLPAWELFDRAVGSLPVHRLLKGRNPFLLQDVVLVPCNPPESEHWTLLAVLPQEKSVVVLDSMPSNQVNKTILVF